MKWKFTKKPKCKLCGRVLKEDYDVIHYRVADREEIQEMQICLQCGDDLENNPQRVE